MTADLPCSNPKPIDWAIAARQAMRDAQTLYTTKSWRNAYVMAALAVEMALKGRIMHTERMNSWPARKRDRPELFSHNLGQLMKVAKLRETLEGEILDQTDIGLAWLAMKDFDINSRYPTGKPFPWKIARDSVEATGKLGLVEWLIADIR